MKEIILENYLNKLNNNTKLSETISLIHDDSLSNEVPIIKDDGLDCLLGLCSIIKPKRILELGTAVGFSSIMMALSTDATIDTIERNEEMYQKAIENINKCDLSKRINVFYNDISEISLDKLANSYDLIFIDAAKAQNKKFFLKFSPLLSDNGIIITDNILFHGLVEKYHNNELTDVSKDLKAMVRKIDEYNIWLKELPEFNTTFLNIGDGLAVSVKK